MCQSIWDRGKQSLSASDQAAFNKWSESAGIAIPNVVNAEAGKFNGQQDTHSQTQREAFRKAKDQNGVTRHL
jgi:hypothetical protein